MDLSTSENIIEAAKTGDYFSLVMAVVVAMPVILLGILKIYGALDNVRRSNSEDQRSRFVILINSLKKSPSTITNLQLEEAFKNYYNYLVSAAEIRSLVGKNNASQTIREFRKVKKYIIYKKSAHNGGSFIWKKRRHRYKIPLFSVKVTLPQLIRVFAYLIFASLAALVFQNVAENYEKITSDSYDIFSLVSVIFSLLYLAIFPLLESVKYRDAEIFIAKYGLRSQDEIE